LLGDAGSTRIDQKEDDKLKESWEKTDVWPITAEQATSISGPGDESGDIIPISGKSMTIIGIMSPLIPPIISARSKRISWLKIGL
jgi:hypothetical protein